MLNTLKSPKVYMVSPRPSKKSNDEKTATLLDHQFGVVIPLVIVLFVVLMIAIGLDQKYSNQPVCNSQVKLKDWVYHVMAMSAGCAILTCTLQVVRIVSLVTTKTKMRNTPLIRVNIMLFVQSAISAASSMLTLHWKFGGICEDYFGVYSPAAQWVEWFVLVPLLNYIACAVEQKTQMDAFDIWMVSLLALMILCGYLLIIQSCPIGLKIVILLTSFLCLVVVTAMTVHNHQAVFEHGIAKVCMRNYFSSKQTHRKATLLVYLLIIMWYYPIVWILGAVQALDANYTFAAYMIGSIFGKVIFSTLVIESHVTLLYEFLITTANSANLGEEDRVVDSSISPKFRREKKSATTSITFPSLLRVVVPKIVPTVMLASKSADISPVAQSIGGEEADVGMSTDIPPEGGLKE